jgi:EF-hand domain pair
MGGITMTKEEWDYLMEECDTNKDGKISREEFLSMMLNPEIAKKFVQDLELNLPNMNPIAQKTAG